MNLAKLFELFALELLHSAFRATTIKPSLNV